MDAIKPSTEGEVASKSELVIHVISVFWKVLFSIVPPTNLGGGWAAFMVSLGFIALMTILVGDLAGLFGCVNVFLGLGLPWLMGALYWSAGASDKAKLECAAMYTSPASKFCSKNVEDHVKNG